MFMIRVTLRTELYKYDGLRCTRDCEWPPFVFSNYRRDMGQRVDCASIQKAPSNTARSTSPTGLPAAAAASTARKRPRASL